ncbi:hypothetical protein A3D85_00430 [Candidatus Amesbacteria bacterium RIFCSPHIGHO2_02_FULL_47_9]|uniref:Uncharacterized protein n=1 Tax=Candidatus Amesbacteria bacterium RIFCSPHIGHO2_01_FULL_48_32b TaxID=1797253 RepID=A0A1F4YHL5_9BACT|nr:MAG: hypothetical protein A2876_05080 [Candidatus Amesbacteria bacterium RIFCSPHIGHO2_01_FULL_48_32b]OGD04892.1 MAG: hypothetical protein A3D85_00430 [Candidatus Amesbacteria bacterium RIFCSPHIGHO2_02_FULL_47_9]OGD07067.1 MAG: hypothetical protein A2899_00335 [Candidatus Amesbacteria bacterium RIFCSPLOWO2_01_FULL_49_25]
MSDLNETNPQIDITIQAAANEHKITFNPQHADYIPIALAMAAFNRAGVAPLSYITGYTDYRSEITARKAEELIEQTADKRSGQFFFLDYALGKDVKTGARKNPDGTITLIDRSGKPISAGKARLIVKSAAFLLEELLDESQVQTVKSVEKVIDAVNAPPSKTAPPVVAVYVDTYLDQINPNYLIFRDPQRFSRFEAVLSILRKHDPKDDPHRMALFEELKDLAKSDVEPGNLAWVFKNGVWAVTPEELLEDELQTRLQEEDADWFQAQRDHFQSWE